MKNTKGFTLVEIMVTLSLLAVVLVPLLSVLSAGHARNAGFERELLARHLAQSKLEEIKAMTWQDFKEVYLAAGQPAAGTYLRFGDAYNDGKYLKQNDDLPENDFTYTIAMWPSLNELSYLVKVTVYFQQAGAQKEATLYTEKLRR